jgi:uncharacterized phage protein gp47/JayE
MSGSQTITWTFTPGTSPTACYIDTFGIHSPPFEDILLYLQAQVQAIFGTDIYLGNDSQDGQMLGIFASAIYDTNSLAIQTYNSFSPATAQGIGLSSVVKINGIARLLPTNSTVDVTISGVVGTQIFNGQVQDLNGNKWGLPPSVLVPTSGEVTVTAIALTAGAITAGPNSVTKIVTPTLGWQSVTNTGSATTGSPLESDVALRRRQTTSTMLPSVTALDGMIGAVAAVEGVTRYAVYENDTNLTDSNGLPGHSVAFVVEGGDPGAIALSIATHKTPGAGTYGTTTEIIVDQYGVPHNIRFFLPTVVPITVVIHLTALTGYTSTIGNNIVSAVINYINSIPIGQSVFLSKVIATANLSNPESLTFNITQVLLARNNGSPTNQDVTIAFNESASANTTLVTLSIP